MRCGCVYFFNLLKTSTVVDSNSNCRLYHYCLTDLKSHIHITQLLCGRRHAVSQLKSYGNKSSSWSRHILFTLTEVTTVSAILANTLLYCNDWKHKIHGLANIWTNQAEDCLARIYFSSDQIRFLAFKFRLVAIKFHANFGPSLAQYFVNHLSNNTQDTSVTSSEKRLMERQKVQALIRRRASAENSFSVLYNLKQSMYIRSCVHGHGWYREKLLVPP